MRWGIPNDAFEYHGTFNLCKKEITDCKEFSIGPNFVVKTWCLEIFSFNSLYLVFIYKKDPIRAKVWP
jgi:hypothetical protein